jgi:hypothetical protein
MYDISRLRVKHYLSAYPREEVSIIWADYKTIRISNDH